MPSFFWKRKDYQKKAGKKKEKTESKDRANKVLFKASDCFKGRFRLGAWKRGAVATRG